MVSLIVRRYECHVILDLRIESLADLESTFLDACEILYCTNRILLECTVQNVEKNQIMESSLKKSKS